VANLMDWQHIRHVPVEDDQHRLVGLVSYRSLLRFLARDLPHGKDHPVPVSEIMNPCPITVGPETSTLEAITIMKEKRVACLPVVKEDRLVGIITERDLVEVARELLEIHLRG
jgi:CBS domain-containing protein